MRRGFAAIAVVLVTGTFLAAQNASKAKNAPARTATKAKATAKGKTAGKSKTKAARRYVQVQPTPERYREIQQALADKGYFSGAADGTWGNDSIEALKRFQKDQSLEPDGKLGSLALIALGLGPKRGAAPPAREAPGEAPGNGPSR